MARLARFGMFSAIGLTGFGLQTAMLAWLTRVYGWHYALAVPATAEVIVLMSFVWHSMWTCGIGRQPASAHTRVGWAGTRSSEGCRSFRAIS